MPSPTQPHFKDETLRKAFQEGAPLLFDGGMGSLIMAEGLGQAGQLSDLLCLSNPADITRLHARYVEAGAQVIATNTFCSNALKLKGAASVHSLYAAAAQCARDANAPYVGGDIGPVGVLLEPYGDLEEKEAEELFAECVQAACDAGCDLILIETMTSIEEAELCVRTAARLCKLPIVATMSFTETGRSFLGVTPTQAAQRLTQAGAHMVGTNCSVGPAAMAATIAEMRQATTLPLLAQPNAGLPHVNDAGETVYDVSPESFVAQCEDILDAGATCLGSCCGSTPLFTAGLKELLAKKF